MRALRFELTGDLSDLSVQEIETPVPTEGQVLVRVAAAAINPSDVKNVQGLMPHTTLPRTPGRDFAGVVVAGTADWQGAEVWGTGGELGFTADGSHAQYLLLPQEAVCRRPAALSAEEAAAVGVPFVTAWSMLVDAGGLTPEDTVVVVGAAGSVGGAALQIARWRGARVLGVVRDPAQAQALTGLGAQAVVCVDAQGLADAVKAATDGRGADLVVDTVGGTMLEPCLNALALHGRLVEITAPQRRAEFDLLDFYRRELTLRGVNTLLLDSVACARILERLAPGFESHALRPPPIARRFPLEEFADAYAQVQSGGAGGKVILAP